MSGHHYPRHSHLNAALALTALFAAVELAGGLISGLLPGREPAMSAHIRCQGMKMRSEIPGGNLQQCVNTFGMTHATFRPEE